MGENPKSINTVGYLAYENICKNQYYSKKILEKKIGFNLSKYNILVCYHSETQNKELIIRQTNILIGSLETISLNKEINILLTYPGDDLYSKYIIDKYKKFKKNKTNVHLQKHLGQNLFFNCLNHFNIILGNSSSLILEAPYFDINILNLGSRQKNRKNVKKINNINFNKYKISSIILKKLKSPKKIINFNKSKKNNVTSNLIIKHIIKYLKSGYKKYPFYDY